jgi:hypothetical protein
VRSHESTILAETLATELRREQAPPPHGSATDLNGHAVTLVIERVEPVREGA